MALFVLLLCPFDISVGIGAFVIRLGQISSFLSLLIKRIKVILKHSYLINMLIYSLTFVSTAPYRTELKLESTELSDVVLTVKARDNDTGINGRISYSIISGNIRVSMKQISADHKQYLFCGLSFVYKISFISKQQSSSLREKGTDLTQSYDKSPYTNRNVKRAKWQHKQRHKKVRLNSGCGPT